METPDLFAFRRLEGWGRLRWYLERIGIPCSSEGLECRGRRHGLPHVGGIIRGKTVAFEPEHVDHWVRHFTGFSLQSWLAERVARRDVEGGGPMPRIRRRVSRSLTMVGLFPQPLLVVTAPDLTLRRGEQVHRDPTGTVRLALGHIPAQPLLFDREIMGPWSCWVYWRARLSTEADFHVSPRRALRKRSAKALVAALCSGGVHGRTLVHVPGEWFGLPKGTTTPFLATRHLPGFPEFVDALRQDPAVAMVTYSHRLLINPITFSPIREDDDSLRDVLAM